MKHYSVTGPASVPEKMLVLASKLAAALRKRKYQARVGVDPLSHTMLEAACNEGMVFSENDRAGVLSIDTNNPNCHSRAMRYFRSEMISEIESRPFYRAVTARLFGISCEANPAMLIIYSADGAYSIQTCTAETDIEVRTAITLAEMTGTKILNLAIPQHLSIAVDIIKKVNHNPMKQMLVNRSRAKINA